MNLEREANTATLEHFTVLQERLGAILDAAYPGELDIDGVINAIDTTKLKDTILDMFTEEAFLRLFSTEMGKGVILGTFLLQEKILVMNEDEEA